MLYIYNYTEKNGKCNMFIYIFNYTCKIVNVKNALNIRDHLI